MKPTAFVTLLALLCCACRAETPRRATDSLPAAVGARPPLPPFVWTSVAPMPDARDLHAAATGKDGRIYVFGGQNAQTSDPPELAYDPGTNTWTAIAPMPARLYAGA